jgi:hypothetical protein
LVIAYITKDFFGKGRETSPDENANPSKSLFRKIFKKKAANTSLTSDREEAPNVIRRSRTVSEIARPNIVFSSIDNRKYF